MTQEAPAIPQAQPRRQPPSQRQSKPQIVAPLLEPAHVPAPAAITAPLLDWYETNKRDLPWRNNPTPYTIWIAEVMAQQTRIAQLMPYYTRFITRFPDVGTLASATEDDVLAAWAGMGYYTRARNLHAAAKMIIDKHNGRLPDTKAGWLSLPGVGAYTAGAIMSIAYGVREAAVDGNVLRVYARLANDGGDIGTSAMKDKATTYILAAMPAEPAMPTVSSVSEDVSRFSQALMELGALVCVPAKPSCGICPLEMLCASHVAGVESQRPVKSAKKPPKATDITVLLIIDPQRRVLMRKRTESLLRGMWVYMLLESELAQPYSADDACAHVRRLGYTVQSIVPAGSATHVFTHRIWRMTGYALYVSESHTPDDYVFLSSDAAADVALPAAMHFYGAWLAREQQS